MSLNYNRLTGEIPDVFQELQNLTNLDLSNNNLSGQLPPSIGKSSGLATIHVQNNQLSGTLDVLQDLEHLEELNVENNRFSGPIPEKLMNIHIFKKDGNSFNSSIAPFAPPPSSRTTPPPAPPFPGVPTPGTQAGGPSTTDESNSKNRKKSSSTKRIVWISTASVMSVIILLLAILLFMPRCFRRTQVTKQVSRRHENPRDEAPGLSVVRPKEEHQPEPLSLGLTPKRRNEQEVEVHNLSAIAKRSDPPPPPPPPSLPPPPPPVEVTAMKSSPKPFPSIYLKSYSIASLQQYTNSFSQENLLGAGMLGSVYRAELPEGKLFAVKKLDKRVSDQQKDDEFIELVNNLDKIRHANVVEIMGYCAEHGQRLLIYEYCSNGTLQDALHSNDEFKTNLSWNSRVRMALGAARALAYLHEVCEPPIIHRNFKSANLLLDDELTVHVSDCGLAPLISTGAVNQLSGQLLTTYGYGAPEFDSGVYTSKSDVYSFGVMMLELLTGRMSYDRTRTRGEQFLVRWAIPQLHDIDALSRMVDPALIGRYSVKSLSHFADIISRCVQPEPEFRPPMSEVVQYLIQMIRRENQTGSDDLG